MEYSPYNWILLNLKLISNENLDSGLLGCDAVSLGQCFLMFQTNTGLSSLAKKVLHSFKTLGNTTGDTVIISQNIRTLNKVSVEISKLSK
jgi:hypothetical protein